ncbi:MAG: hypothetical protein ACYDA8_20360 [Deferrisomatales bacterium]
MKRRALAAALALALTGAAHGGPEAELSFARLNRDYPDLIFQAEPAAWGPFEVGLRSPRFTLRLESHRLRLAPAGGGAHRARLEAVGDGHGWLVADLTVAGLATHREDAVEVPRQALAVDAVVRIERQAGGYRVTPVGLPRSVRVRLRSRTAQELVAWCDGSALLALAGVECDDLGEALSWAAVPLPPPGQAHWLAEADLAPGERAALDAYLRGAEPP